MAEPIDRVGTGELTPAVREALGDPRLTPRPEFRRTRVGGQVHEGTLGVYAFDGSADGPDGSRDYRLVLKLMDPGSDPRLLAQVPRECKAYRLLEGQVGMLRPARCYGVLELGDGITGLWLEDLRGLGTPPWSEADYRLAAEAIARFHGRSLERGARPEPWMGRSSLFGFAHADLIIQGLEALRARLRADGPLAAGLPTDLVEPVFALWDRKEDLFRRLERLPRVLAHQDFHNGNAFIARAKTGDQVVAVDWAYFGAGGVGEDCGTLVISDLLWLRMSPDAFRALEPGVFGRYLETLRSAGYDGDAQAVRLGHVALAGLGGSLRLLFASSRVLSTSGAGPSDPLPDFIAKAAQVLAALAPLVDEVRGLVSAS